MFAKTATAVLFLAAAMGAAHAEGMAKTDAAMHDMEMAKKECMMKVDAEADKMKHDQMLADCMEMAGKDMMHHDMNGDHQMGDHKMDDHKMGDDKMMPKAN